MQLLISTRADPNNEWVLLDQSLTDEITSLQEAYSSWNSKII